MRISDWSSDVCSSDLFSSQPTEPATRVGPCSAQRSTSGLLKSSRASYSVSGTIGGRTLLRLVMQKRSEEHTSELQSLMRISYAVFCLKKKTQLNTIQHNQPHTHQYYRTNSLFKPHTTTK